METTDSMESTDPMESTGPAEFTVEEAIPVLRDPDGNRLRIGTPTE
ncbi:hypothetical protein [Streptomyces cinereoruber]